MIVKGFRPPWEGQSEYGSWRRLPQPSFVWFVEEPTLEWEWVPPQPARGSVLIQMGEILKNLYVPAITKQLSEPSPFLAVLEAEVGQLKGRSEKERRAEIRTLQRTIKRLLGKGGA